MSSPFETAYHFAGELHGRHGDSHAPIDLLPTSQLGYINPTRVSDSIHYQFYRVCPPDMFLLAYPINLGAFSPEGVDAALASFWPAFEFLAGRNVDRIVQGGIPVSAIAGRKRILGFIEEAAALLPDYHQC